jgi:hypothetical protein
MINKADLKQFKQKVIHPDTIKQQIENFRQGFPFIHLSAAATPSNGIRVLEIREVEKLKNDYEHLAKNFEIIKMVPASGAASRMFKDLFAFLDEDHTEVSKAVLEFLERIHDFAFFPALKKALSEDDYDLEELLADGEYKTIVAYLINKVGLDYASLPKGLLLFHRYPGFIRTPLEEHIAEGIEYSRGIDGSVQLHFTVSPEHMSKFIQRAEHAVPVLEKEYNCSIRISYSAQKPSTDTIAVDMQNEAFRNADGSILFRPGGHGALIENLNDLNADIVFIKNIDNVVPDNLKQPTYIYKKAIGALLIRLMKKSFSIIAMIENKEMDAEKLEDAITFAKDKLNINFPDGMNALSREDQCAILLEKLNRPIRICGMVKNEGEPGGGPFWVKDDLGNTSLQIVESSQIDMNNEAQKAIVQHATHFNPVDLVCSIKDFKGKKFDLRNFVDPKTGFISVKSKDGKELKAQELPGLWNGAMANWITIFVEVPIETFNPVKTVNDLLRPQHQ